MEKVSLKPNLNRSPNANLILAPKPKVWKILKKVKKNWSHELKRASSHYYENMSRH